MAFSGKSVLHLCYQNHRFAIKRATSGVAGENKDVVGTADRFYTGVQVFPGPVESFVQKGVEDERRGGTAQRNTATPWPSL